MVAEIASFFSDLNEDELRIYRPSRFLFLCGGAIEQTPAAKAANLRDYIYRVRPLRAPYPIILAEAATQLYRDTSYHDLISFEEDIARIASVVMVIAESAGSLAELGAFASNDAIRPSLRVVLPQHHATANSFVRWGPVERVRKQTRKSLWVFPWRTHANGRLVISSTRPHYASIKGLIKKNIESTPASVLFCQLGAAQSFYIIYWVIFLALAITPTRLYESVKRLTALNDLEIRNKVYCMELAGWVKTMPYGDTDYFYTAMARDPFDYRFKVGVTDKDSVRRKFAVTSAFRRADAVPPPVLRHIAAARL